MHRLPRTTQGSLVAHIAGAAIAISAARVDGQATSNAPLPTATTRPAACDADEVAIRLADFPYDFDSLLRDHLRSEGPAVFEKMSARERRRVIDRILNETEFNETVLVMPACHVPHTFAVDCQCAPRFKSRLRGFLRRTAPLGGGARAKLFKAAVECPGEVHERACPTAKDGIVWKTTLVQSIGLVLESPTDRGYYATTNSWGSLCLKVRDVPIDKPCPCIKRIAKPDPGQNAGPALNNYWTKTGEFIGICGAARTQMLKSCIVRATVAGGVISSSEIITVAHGASVELVLEKDKVGRTLRELLDKPGKVATAGWEIERAASGEIRMKLKPMSATTFAKGGGLFVRRPGAVARVDKVVGASHILTMPKQLDTLEVWPASSCVRSWTQMREAMGADRLRTDSHWHDLLRRGGYATPACSLEGITEYWPVHLAQRARKDKHHDFVTEILVVADGSSLEEVDVTLPTISGVYRVAGESLAHVVPKL